MSNQDGKAAFEFVRSFLQNRPGTPYAEVAVAAKAKGFTIWPIVYGRAQLLLGHAKVKPATRQKAADRAKAKSAAAASPSPISGSWVGTPAPLRRGPGRPRKAAWNGSPGADSLELVVAHVRAVEREREQLHSVLLKLRSVLDAL